MKAMVLAAGLGTRLRPLTFEIPKPMVPVLDRPVMAHIVDLCRSQGFDQLIANLHYFPETIKDYFGDSIEYRFEGELMGTAGGVRNVRDFFGDDLVVIISGDALTDIDLKALVKRHESHGGIGTLTVKRVDDTREYGVVLHDSDGRISGFQEKPHPDEALSDLGNCGIYMFRREIFDHFPETEFVDWAMDVFPRLLEGDVSFYVHEFADYWNDIGSLDEYRQGNFDALAGKVRLEVGGGDAPAGADAEIEGPALFGDGCEIGDGAWLHGPLVVGDGARIGAGAKLREAVVLPGAEVPPGAALAGAIVLP